MKFLVVILLLNVQGDIERGNAIGATQNYVACEAAGASWLEQNGPPPAGLHAKVVCVNAGDPGEIVLHTPGDNE